MSRNNSTTSPGKPLARPYSFHYAGNIVATKRATTKLSVCILSPHPLVLSEFERLLAKPQFKVTLTHLESVLAPDLRTIEPPQAQVYVIDAHAARPATGALLANILERYPEARLIVVGEQLSDANSYSLLRLGVKGLLTYVEAREQFHYARPGEVVYVSPDPPAPEGAVSHSARK